MLPTQSPQWKMIKCDRSYLLLPQSRLVTANRTQSDQLRLLLADPVVEVPETEEESTPVLPSVLQTRSEDEENYKKDLKFISLILFLKKSFILYF